MARAYKFTALDAARMYEVLEIIEDLAHTAANGGLRFAGQREKISDHKNRWRTVRGYARGAMGSKRTRGE